jgi:predicted RNA binding protein YcfA (HicA-like mRNA interferase family)
MRENPRSLSFGEIDAFLKREGWRVVNVTGSHFLYDKLGQKLLVVKPHGSRKTLHPKGVKKILRALQGGEQ